MDIRPIQSSDREWVRGFIQQHWGAEFIVSRGVKHLPHECDGLVACDSAGVRVGLLTYLRTGDRVEILTFDCPDSQKGIGTLLLDGLVAIAKSGGVKALWLITSNDNLDALRFYQRRGFRLTAIHSGAISVARKMKPSIPLNGYFNIPVVDEIELTYQM